MESDAGFYTMKGYDLHGANQMSSAMEDYLEMICRCSQTSGYIRINLLAQKLNVTPPSSSKMASKLREQGYVEFERYGIVTPTAKGWQLGNYLLHRHEVLHRFFCRLNGSEDELQLVEQIEHFIDPVTVANLEKLANRE